MATYTIRTTRAQEIGLKFAYDHYADKTTYPTQESYFQFRINTQVTNPMYREQQQAQATSFDQSFNTVPELEQPATRTELEGVIVAHGGTIVPPGPTLPAPMPPPGPPSGVLNATKPEN